MYIFNIIALIIRGREKNPKGQTNGEIDRQCNVKKKRNLHQFHGTQSESRIITDGTNVNKTNRIDLELGHKTGAPCKQLHHVPVFDYATCRCIHTL